MLLELCIHPPLTTRPLLILSWVQDRNGNSPAQLAAAEGHISVVARILDSGRQGEDKGLSALHLATQAGVIPLVRQLLALPHCDRNAQDADGLTPLHWAASKGALISILAESLGFFTALDSRVCMHGIE